MPMPGASSLPCACCARRYANNGKGLNSLPLTSTGAHYAV